jgi:hypothetical protein
MDFKEKVLEIASSLGYMPSSNDLNSMGLSAISSRFQKNGGFVALAKELGFENKKPITSWTDQKIEEEIAKAVEFYGRFPSAKELREIGKNDLCCAISKNGGFLFWAKKVNQERKMSDSDTGWEGEKKLVGDLAAKGFSCVRSQNTKCPYDLLVNTSIRVDVKAANYAEYGPCKGWFYRIAKDAQADIIALYQLDTADVYFIPWNLCPKTNVTISRSGGKYKDFKNRFDILENLVNLRQAEKDIWPKLI